MLQIFNQHHATEIAVQLLSNNFIIHPLHSLRWHLLQTLRI